MDKMNAFTNSEHKKLYQTLIESGVVKKHDAGTIVHALYDIAESMEKIYGGILQRITLTKPEDKDTIQEALWDLREEC